MVTTRGFGSGKRSPHRLVVAAAELMSGALGKRRLTGHVNDLLRHHPP
jgi:hypothetical protein